jgi:hypothetical protein
VAPVLVREHCSEVALYDCTAVAAARRWYVARGLSRPRAVIELRHLADDFIGFQEAMGIRDAVERKYLVRRGLVCARCNALDYRFERNLRQLGRVAEAARSYAGPRFSSKRTIGCPLVTVTSPSMMAPFAMAMVRAMMSAWMTAVAPTSNLFSTTNLP